MRSKILIVSPTPTHPPDAGNRVRILRLAKTLGELGHTIHFAHVERVRGDSSAMSAFWGERYHPVPYERPRRPWRERVRRCLRSLGVAAAYRMGVDEWYDPGVDDTLSQLQRAHHFDTVIVEYVFLSRALAQFGPEVAKLLDTHDVMSDRHLRYLRSGQIPVWFSTSRKEESRALKRADTVIAIQEHEAASFRSMGASRVITVSHPIALSEGDQRLAAVPMLLFVGSRNPINVLAAKICITEILPRVADAVPAVELAIVGGVCDGLDPGKGVRLLGVVDELDPVYAQAWVVINPVTFGTGLKIKNIEALGYGCPLVTTSVGAEGLESGVGSALLVCDTPEGAAASVIELVRDVDRRQAMREAALAFAREWNRNCLDELQKALSEHRSGAVA